MDAIVHVGVFASGLLDVPLQTDTGVDKGCTCFDVLLQCPKWFGTSVKRSGEASAQPCETQIPKFCLLMSENAGKLQ
jgi:hypothetical protein